MPDSADTMGFMPSDYSWPETLTQLLDRRDLTVAQASRAMEAVMAGEVTDSQMAAFLVALRAKSETVDEIVGFRDAVLKHAVALPIDPMVLDIVGTGGDPYGAVVNVSSITGVISAPYMPAYSVSKAALISFTKVIARELAPQGITANAVCPGFIYTPMWDALGQTMAEREGHTNGRAVFDQRVQTHVPMQRPQTADDVAHCVAFLCGDAARHITGQVIGVDGGVTI